MSLSGLLGSEVALRPPATGQRGNRLLAVLLIAFAIFVAGVEASSYIGHGCLVIDYYLLVLGPISLEIDYRRI